MATHDHTRHHDHDPARAAGVKGPVCGMTVDPATANHHAVHTGRDY